MEEARIIVTGKVQMQSFRKHIREIAVKHSLFGYVQNLKDYKRSVEIVCQGEKAKIVLFISELEALKSPEKTKMMLALVEDIKPVYREPTIKYTDFDIYRRDDEMGERFDEGVEQIMKLREETAGKFDQMDKKYGTISETMKALISELATGRAEITEKQTEILRTQNKLIETQNILVSHITSKK